MTITRPIKVGIAGVLAAALSLALVLMVPAAQASNEDDTMGVVDCLFDGLAGIADPGVQSIDNDLAGGNLLDVDHGSFEFRGDATCTGQDVGQGPDHPDTPTLEPVLNNIHIAAAGHYDNLVCGTGTASGAASLSDISPNARDLITGDLLEVDGPGVTLALEHVDGLRADFGIAFVAGNGKISGANADGSIQRVDGNGDPVGPANVVHSGQSDGVVNIIPNFLDEGGNCLDEDVTEFIVTGAFTAVLGGQGTRHPEQ